MDHFLNLGDHIDEKTNEGRMPGWFVVIFSILTILLAFACYWACTKGEAKSLLEEEKAVAKMRKSFERYGYFTEYVKVLNCGTQVARCTYIRFIRTRSIRPLNENSTSGSSTIVGDTGDENRRPPNDAFDPEAWKPLEGTWKRIDDDSSTLQLSEKGIPSWMCNLEETIVEVSGTSDEQSFGVLRKSRMKKCFGLFSSDYLQVGRPEGNQLRFKSQSTAKVVSLLETKLASDTLDENIKSTLRASLDSILHASTFYPIQGSCTYGSANFFRSVSGGSVWKVDGYKLIMYPDLADEWFSDEDILNGCLEDMMMMRMENDNDDNNLVSIEYELVQEHPPIIRSSSFWENVWESFYDPASEAEEKKAKQILLLSASFAVPMIVIFFTSTSFGSDVSTIAKIWLIITGICGMINFMYSFFITPYCQQQSSSVKTFPAMFSSGIYMICVLILLIGLLIKWNQWTPIWEGLVGLILGFVIVALLSAIANFYAYNQLRIIHTRKESNINTVTTTSTSTSTELSPIYSDNPTEIV